MSGHSFRDDLINGFKGKCPCCRRGKLFSSYLKATEKCDVCGEELHHHRADDLPAYFSILIVGHIVVLSAISFERHYHPSLWLHMLIWLPVTTILCLLILPPIKGAAIAIQWRLGMHGFGKSKRLRDSKTDH